MATNIVTDSSGYDYSAPTTQSYVPSPAAQPQVVQPQIVQPTFVPPTSFVQPAAPSWQSPSSFMQPGALAQTISPSAVDPLGALYQPAAQQNASAAEAAKPEAAPVVVAPQIAPDVLGEGSAATAYKLVPMTYSNDAERIAQLEGLVAGAGNSQVGRMYAAQLSELKARQPAMEPVVGIPLGEAKPTAGAALVFDDRGAPTSREVNARNERRAFETNLGLGLKSDSPRTALALAVGDLKTAAGYHDSANAPATGGVSTAASDYVSGLIGERRPASLAGRSESFDGRQLLDGSGLLGKAYRNYLDAKNNFLSYERGRPLVPAEANQLALDAQAPAPSVANEIKAGANPPPPEVAVVPPPVAVDADPIAAADPAMPAAPVSPAAAVPVEPEKLDPYAAARMEFIAGRAPGYASALKIYNDLAAKTPKDGVEGALNSQALATASDSVPLKNGRAIEANLAALEADPANRGARLAFRLIEPTEADLAAGTIEYSSESPDYAGFAAHVVEQKRESAVPAAARAYIDGYRRMQSLSNLDTSGMSQEQVSAVGTELASLKSKYGDVPLDLSTIDDYAKLSASIMSTYLRGEEGSQAALDKHFSDYGRAASDAVLDATLSKYGVSALMDRSDPTMIPLTRVPPTKTSFAAEATLARQLGRFDVALGLETIESRAQDLPALAELRGAAMNAVSAAAAAYDKVDLPAETREGLALLTETQQSAISAQERVLAGQVKRGTMTLPEYQAALNDFTRSATLQMQSGASTLMKSMVSENPIFGRRGDGKLVWDWGGIMGALTVASALYAPFERRESERRAEKNKEKWWEKEKAWEREKAQMQQDFWLERQGALEAGDDDDGGGGGVAGFRPASF